VGRNVWSLGDLRVSMLPDLRFVFIDFSCTIKLPPSFLFLCHSAPLSYLPPHPPPCIPPPSHLSSLFPPTHTLSLSSLPLSLSLSLLSFQRSFLSLPPSSLLLRLPLRLSPLFLLPPSHSPPPPFPFPFPFFFSNLPPGKQDLLTRGTKTYVNVHFGLRSPGPCSR
jgi:hypothetical protein